MTTATGYRGRFAPSPTGPLHAGSLVAALGSWLDARAHGGRWLVRIEDVDSPRCSNAAAEHILQQLALCGMTSDEPVVWQSQRTALYEAALNRLIDQHDVYRCRCSRSDIDLALAASGRLPDRHVERVYPGTCRHAGLSADVRGGWRQRSQGHDSTDLTIQWNDRRLGPRTQNLTGQVGDFILQRSDGLWAYQLAVVVDDAQQMISDVVRGEDLADNTPRQIHLQHRLGLPMPRYLHLPVVLAADGQKLSKQNGAVALDVSDPLRALCQAATVLGLPTEQPSLASDRPLPEWLAAAVSAWSIVACSTIDGHDSAASG